MTRRWSNVGSLWLSASLTPVTLNVSGFLSGTVDAERSLLPQGGTLPIGATISDVAEDGGYQSIASFLEAVPGMASKLEHARTGLAQQGVSSYDGAALADALKSCLNQRLLVGWVQKRKHTAHLRSLSELDAAVFRGAGGPGAAGFLEFPSEPACAFEDCMWSVSLRQRLGMRRAEASAQELNGISSNCQLRPRNGGPCGAQLDDAGVRALTDLRQV